MPSEQPRANSVKSQRGSGRQHCRHPSATPQRGFKQISDRFRTDPSLTKCRGDPNFISNLRVLLTDPSRAKCRGDPNRYYCMLVLVLCFQGGVSPGYPGPPGGFRPIAEIALLGTTFETCLGYARAKARFS